MALHMTSEIQKEWSMNGDTEGGRNGRKEKGRKSKAGDRQREREAGGKKCRCINYSCVLNYA